MPALVFLSACCKIKYAIMRCAGRVRGNQKVADVLPRVLRRGLKASVGAMEAINRRFSLVGQKAVFDPAEFPWINSVEEEWESVRSELDDILKFPNGIPNFQDISIEQKSITRHRGPYNGVLRYHLGLMVPEPSKCGITVGDVTARWREGGSVVFDDSFQHEAWNESSEMRVVLFVDFLRPLHAPVALLNR